MFGGAGADMPREVAVGRNAEIDRWGGAPPRSATATRAREASARLHCPAAGG
jgi:hypothetical protein